MKQNTQLPSAVVPFTEENEPLLQGLIFDTPVTTSLNDATVLKKEIHLSTKPHTLVQGTF